MRNPDLCVEQFEKFYDLLMSNAPEGYTPWFFPCKPNTKNPSAEAILKIDPTSRGSWEHPSARLTKEQCIQHIKAGYNIGLSARDGDKLIIIDIDNPLYLNQLPENTLTTTSRKRIGGHAFGWDKDGTAKINLPTDDGEIRSCNQYLIACGSYIPFDLTKKKDEEAFHKLPKEAREDDFLGYYTIKSAIAPRELSFDDLPQFFKDKQRLDTEQESEILQKEEKKEYKTFSGEGKYSELFKLKVSDIIGLIPESKRVGHPLHESDTDANFSLSKDGTLGHCWRHLVSLNAVQYLCVLAGYKSCGDAGSPHAEKKIVDGKIIKKPRGISKIRGDKKALEVAYEKAVELGLIKKYQKNVQGNNQNTDNEPAESYGSTPKDYLIYSAKFNTYFPNVDKIAYELIDELDCATIYGKNSEVVYTFDGVCWKPNGKEEIKTKVENILETYSKTKVVNEVYEKIKRLTNKPQDYFDNLDKNLIPLENGVWNIREKKLEEHKKENRFRFILPLKYDKYADCPNFKKYLDDVACPEDIPVMQEWFGFNLYREYFIKKGLILVGQKDTGKSVFLDTLIYFIGEKNKTGIPLQKVSSGNDFTKLSLKDKHANIYDDLSSKDLSDGGGFKIATGGGYISGEEKFGDYQQFLSFAKQTFATNKIPPVKDNDDMAYFGRWIVFRFDNVPEKINPFLRRELFTEKEMSGILNWALDGLYRLLENGCFSYTKSPEEVKIMMEMSGDSIIQFSTEVLEKSDNERISTEQMFEIYTLWANETNRPRKSKEQLGRCLPEKVKYLVQKRDSERYWANVKINQSWKEKLELIGLSKTKKKQDTLDTSKTSIREQGYSIGIDMFENKTSNPSNQESFFEELKVEVERV